MSTQQYPQSGGDESGLVPPQNTDRTEWPKRLRALTADELDRLTIDRDGRMYWDGKAVNYPEKAQPMAIGPTTDKKAPDENKEREAIDMLERATADLAGQKPDANEAAPFEETPPAEPALTVEAATPTEAATLTEAAPSAEAGPSVEPASSVEAAPPVPAKTSMEIAPRAELRAVDVARPQEFASRTAASERIRLKLSPMQSLAMVIATVALFAAAFGIAASGFVAANEWGCRVGWITTYCPPKPPHPLSARIFD